MPEMGIYTQQDAIADIATHAADLDAHTLNIGEILRTGYYHNFFPGAFSAQAALTANRLYAGIAIVSRNVTITRLGINVRVAGAGGSKARLGIYQNGTNLYPGALLKDFGEVAADGVAAVEITFTQALAKGIYWFAIVSDSTPTIRNGFGIYLPMGCSALLTDSYPIVSWYVAHVYAALPDPFTADGTEDTVRQQVLAKLGSLD